MPLDLLTLTPSRRSVRFEEPLHDHVVKQQQRYKRYGDKLTRAKESKLNPGDQVRVKLPNRATKMDPVWSEPHTVVETPSEHTATLDDGTTWNNEKLRVESPAVSPGKQSQLMRRSQRLADPNACVADRLAMLTVGERSWCGGEEKCSIL